MPSAAPNPWVLFTALAGFGPGFTRYAALQDNSEAASSGTIVDPDGGVSILKTVAGKRDRYAGTWLTPYAWPDVLPGTAV
jgi:hypothetical protein